DAISDLAPWLSERTEDDELRDRAFHRAALAHRERHLVERAAARLKALIDQGVDTFTAFARCQDHLQKLALAHVERAVLERFAAAADEAPESELRPVLTLLCDVYALATIEADRGWFLESGGFSAETTKAARALLDRLTGELRVHALPLVDAFGIPDACLA